MSSVNKGAGDSSNGVGPGVELTLTALKYCCINHGEQRVSSI